MPVIRQSPFIRALTELQGQVELAVAGLRRLHQASTGEQPSQVQRAQLRLAAAHAVNTGSHVVRGHVWIGSADATLDHLSVNGLEGTDTITPTPGASELIGLTLVP